MDDTRRKLTAILVADVKGYTRLMERDEESTRILINLHRQRFKEICRTVDGRIIDTSGDSILADFPSVQAAVESAVAFQTNGESIQIDIEPRNQMVFRVGVHVGDVIDDGKSIYGDAVNTAAHIQSLATPGGVCVSGAVRELVEGRVAMNFEFMREQRVKNRRRLVQVFKVCIGPDAGGNIDPKSPRLWRATGSMHPGIAVLPFVSLDGGTDNQYLGDGIAEDIIVDLSRFRSIQVLARTTSFSFRNIDDRFQKLHDELGVDYALEGSIRAVGGKVRINAQLVDCDSGKQLWGDRYTHDAGAIFEVQDEVVSMIVSMLENRLLKKRAPIVSSSVTHRAYDYWLRGNRLLERGAKENNELAESFFNKALELDAKFSRAYTSLATILFQRATLLPGEDEWRSDVDRAFDLCVKALEIDPADGRAHAHAGWGCLLKANHAGAIHHYEMAGDLNPNDADILISRARALAFLGSAPEGLVLAWRAIRLNPVHPGYYLEHLAIVQFLARRFDDCVHTLTQSPPVSPEGSAMLAAACSHTGAIDMAHGAVADYLQVVRANWRGNISPDTEQCMQWLGRVLPIRARADRQLLFNALETVGLGPLAAELSQPFEA
ncbi:MAG: adenylate class-3/4/guanylyl cyclase [marine bacterium B5-7]|nr:MAG: adenylate class-3/4/guanylyl cyclase [marine bacterium B5-7]